MNKDIKQNSVSEYSYNKALRFKLEHLAGPLPAIPQGQANSKNLIETGNLLADEFEKFIYIVNDDGTLNRRNGQKVLTKHISIKKQWLRQYFKNDFYAFGRQGKDSSLADYKYIQTPLCKWFEDFREQLSSLQQVVSYADHQKSRRSEIANILTVINSKGYFVFVKDFCEYANHKANQSLQNNLQKLVNEFEQQLTAGINEYLPAQSAGLVIAQGSMNYYTVNKKPKNYQKEIDGLGIKLDELEHKYTEYKENKANQKSKLYELINTHASKERIKEECDLFGDNCDDNCLEKVTELTLQIEKLNENKDSSNNLSLELKKEIKNLKQQRGHYFIKQTRGKTHDMYFKTYWKYCEEYKKIAIDRGKMLAKINGIKREQIESGNLKYWSLIFDNGSEKHLWLIPKDKMQEFHDSITADKQSLCILHTPHSLTMRALHKLCFAEESSFVENMPGELKSLQSGVKKATNDQNNRNFNADRSKDVLALEFLKKLMQSKYAHDILDLQHFDLSELQNTDDLNKFEAALEQACYYMEPIALSAESADNAINTYNILIFKITSYDLEKRNQNTHQTAETKGKTHTREIWDAFWMGDANIRLNPEIKIRFRQKNEELTEYMENKGFDLSKVKNRFLQEQYTAGFTFTLNAGKRYPRLAFAKTEDICQEINNFNQKFNEQNWQGTYKYGIDRGNIELSTLCIAKFDQNDTYNYNGKSYLKPSFPQGQQDIKVYELKKQWYDQKQKSDMENIPYENRKEKRIIANLSYFIDKIEDASWFDKKNCSCIDLTTAKVIKDKIILNGDVLTFLKLKKEAAKRVLFELVADGKITDQNKELKWASDNTDSFKSIELRTEQGNTIYFFEGKHGRNFEGLLVKDDIVYTRDNIKDNLQSYLDNLLEEKSKQSSNPYKHVPPIAKINNLRKAIAANMVGVVCYLQKQYPGIIVLEDLEDDTIKKHFSQMNINISRPLERALIDKFQTVGKVPPHIKDIIEIRERFRRDGKAKSSQLGALVFVDKSETSAQCPYCGESWTWDKSRKDKLKFLEHRYICGENEPCGFDTENIEGKTDFLKEINDPDKIAAYNVAKKIQDYKNIEQLKILTGENKKQYKGTNGKSKPQTEYRQPKKYQGFSLEIPKKDKAQKNSQGTEIDKLIKLLLNKKAKEVSNILKQLKAKDLSRSQIEQIEKILNKRHDAGQADYNPQVKKYFEIFNEIKSGN
ncbi:MAG: hypothetical protein JEZ07_04640 [Phycisphaerae bacterium]|nr:hypothetical protein [Phycisphaerae bacterium]